MKTKILSITLVFSLLLTMFAVPVMAEAEDIVVYSQDFEALTGMSGGALTTRDKTINSVGEKPESATTVKVLTEPEYGRYLESFTTVADTNGLANIQSAVSLLSGDEAGVMTASVENHALVLDKTATGKTGIIYYDFNSDKIAKKLDNYTVEFDLKTAFTSLHTLNVTLGADFSIRCADIEKQLCTIEYHNGKAWVATDKTTYDFSDYQHITLVVKTSETGTKTVDLYVGSGEDRVLAYEDIPQRDSNNFKKIKYTVGSGAKCKMYLDNIGVTTNIPEGRSDVLYVNNFNGLTEVPAEFSSAASDFGNVAIEEDMLAINKTASGGTPTLNFSVSPYLKGAGSYSLAFDIASTIINSTTMIYLGGGIGLRPVADNASVYTVEYYYTAADETETSGFKPIENFTVDLNNPVNFRIEVKNQTTANVMINGEYLMASETDKLEITQRAGYSWDKFTVTFGSGAKGSVYIDNVAITKGTAVYVPEDAELEADENSFMQISKLYEKNGTYTRFVFDEYLCGADDYTLAFDIHPMIGTGSVNIYMGAFFELLRKSEGVYTINYREGAETSNKVLADNLVIDGWRTFEIKVTDGTSFGLYIDGEVIGDGITARSGYSAKQFYIARNNGMLGSLLIDDVTLTLNGVNRAEGVAGAYGDDFESYTTGPVVSDVGGFKTTATPEKGLVSIENFDEAHGKVLRMYSSVAGSHTPYHVTRNYSSVAKTAKKYTVSFDAYLTGIQSYSITEKRSGSGGFKTNLDLTLGCARYQKNGTWVSAENIPVVKDTWYTVKYVIDTEANLADVYINDVLLVEDLDSFQDSPYGALTISTNNGTQGSLYLDNLSVTVNEEREAYVSAQYEEGVISVDGYMPVGSDSRLFVAYFDAEDNGELLKVDIIPCKAGKIIEETITEVPENTVMINAMLWKSDITPVCANARLSIAGE